MLRLIVLFLLLANGAYYAWSQGLLMPWGVGPLQQSEPQRMQQQLQPEGVRLLPAEELRALEAQVAQVAPAARASECLASATLAEPQAATVRTALQSWPAGSWTLEPVVEPPRWILYMGKYADPEQLARKRAELRQLGIAFDAPARSAAGAGALARQLQQRALRASSSCRRSSPAACAARGWCRSGPSSAASAWCWPQSTKICGRGWTN
jgi:hypothetical protein